MLKQLFVLLFTLILIAACGDNKNEPEKILSDKEKYAFDSTDLKLEGIDNSGKPFLMEYKFKKGDKVSYRLTNISNNVQTMIMDTTISQGVEQKIVYLLDLIVNEVDEEGTSEVDIKVNSVKLEATAGAEYFKFEAGKDTSKEDIKKYAEFQSFYNNSFSVRFNKKGDILEIFRADKISNKFLEIKEAADSLTTEQKSMIRQDLINKLLQPIVTQLIRKVPLKEVYKDSTWQIQQPTIPFLSYQIDYTNTYKVASVEKLDDDRIAVIDAGAIFNYSGQSKANQGGILYTFQKPLSTAEGKIYFDVDKGHQIKSRTKTRFEITYTMEANTPMGKQKGTRKDLTLNIYVVEKL